MTLELDLRPPMARTPEQAVFERLNRRIVELETRIRNLERLTFAVPVNAGTPAAGDGKSGSLAGDATNTRLWLKLGSTWRYVTLT